MHDEEHKRQMEEKKKTKEEPQDKVRHPIHVFATDWIAKFKTFAFVRSSV
jgi:hypothetical protein